jgi:hypothetical protein
LTTSGEAYKTALVKIINDHLRAGPGAVLTPEEVRALMIVDQCRALAVGTGSSGGFNPACGLPHTISRPRQET